MKLFLATIIVTHLWMSFWHGIEADEAPLLLVVAFDGFRWDYVSEHRTPYLWQIVTKGVWAPNGVRNQFPTVTLPNFYSIVTGLHKEKHGLIGNIMYDPDFKEDFDYWQTGNPELFENSRNSKWYSGIPIWQANENGEKSRLSGAMRFPLCDSKINNRSLFKCEPVRLTESSNNWISQAETDIETLIQWYLDPKNPINFGLIYLSEPDAVEHDNDIHSDKVSEIFEGVDFLINFLNRRLASVNLRDKMNIMYVSDHGHVNVYKEWNTINFDKMELNPKDYKWSGRSVFPITNITTENLYKKIKSIQQKQPKFNVWLKEESPDYLRYKKNRRIGPIVVTEHLGYSIVSHGETEKYLPPVRGMHGYSNEYREMWPMFVASGPSFKKNYQIDDILETVDYYTIMCEVLQINCPVNDGNFRRAHKMLLNLSANGKKWLETNASLRMFSFNFHVIFTCLLFFTTFCFT